MSPSSQESSYHPQGELEVRGVDRLPPTPLTEAAYFALQDMGLREEHIQELRELTASFRYDRCREKLLRLTEAKVQLIKRGGKDTVLLPQFFDLQGRLDGQCADIAIQFWLQAEISGWLADAQDEGYLEPGDRLVVCLCSGYSRTHFIHSEADHQWNGLALVGRDRNVKSFVSIDAAFQEISTLTESGYAPDRILYGPEELEGFPPAAEIRVKPLRREGKSFRGDFTQAMVLGTSPDKKYVYCLGFVQEPASKQPLFSLRKKNVEPKPIIPYLTRLNSQGETGSSFFHPDTGNLVTSIPPHQLTLDEKAELTDLLNICAKFRFENKGTEKVRNLPQTLRL